VRHPSGVALSCGSSLEPLTASHTNIHHMWPYYPWRSLQLILVPPHWGLSSTLTFFHCFQRNESYSLVRNSVTDCPCPASCEAKQTDRHIIIKQADYP
jgi:hypothetical protein